MNTIKKNIVALPNLPHPRHGITTDVYNSHFIILHSILLNYIHIFNQSHDQIT